MGRAQATECRSWPPSSRRRGGAILRWASLEPLSRPWTDEAAARLSWNFNRITTDTALFGEEAASLMNDYFTAAMIADVFGTSGLDDYHRGRLATERPDVSRIIDG